MFRLARRYAFRTHMIDIFAPTPHINTYLAQALAARALPPALHEATAYSLLAPGKRLRPLLCWHACEAFGVPGVESLPSAAALELIHCFSLVHDDLPALDNDDLRRGLPTLHKHAGEPMAILAGDLMHTLAFALLAERAPAAHDCAKNLIYELSTTTECMIIGQVYDTLGGLDDVAPPERAELIHTNKTGALIRASCRMGVLHAFAAQHMHRSDSHSLAHTMPEALALHHITRYADALGLIFQITDDLLDVTQTAEHVGKRTNKDAAAGKITYPGILGIEGSRAEVRRQEHIALSAVEPLGDTAAVLIEICLQMSRRTK